MSDSPLKNPVLPAALFAGAMFSSLTVPLAMFGSGPVDVQLNQEPVFSGTIKDLAAPYVGVVGILSIGAGVAGVAIAGWQQSSRRSGQVEAKLSNLQQQLKEKELQLEAAMLSEQRLEASGLDFFLQDETVIDTVPSVKTAESKPGTAKAQLPVADSRAKYTPVVQPVIELEPNLADVQSVVSTLAAAQAFLSFNRPNGSPRGGADNRLMVEESLTANTSLQALQDQLKQIMSQVETLRSSLEADARPTQQPAYTVNNVAHSNHRSAEKPQWVMQSAAS